jgi:predicted nucleotide-binding protein
MAAKKAPAGPPSRGPTLTATEAVRYLADQVTVARGLIAQGTFSEQAHDAWETEARHWLESAFGEDSQKVYEVINAGPRVVIDRDAGEVWLSTYRLGILQAQLGKLETMVRILQAEAVRERALTPAREPEKRDAVSSKKVFIVHGHDDPAKETVARFIAKLKLEDVILHEKANAGRTIIEKFEAHADVAFAVVLLTPDDRGGTAKTPYDDQRSRARQNVILELGYFLGRLGRHKVCALYKDGVELPSDMAGVLYVSLDAGGLWKAKLAKEIREVIPTVDLTDAI